MAEHLVAKGPHISLQDLLETKTELKRLDLLHGLKHDSMVHANVAPYPLDV